VFISVWNLVINKQIPVQILYNQDDIFQIIEKTPKDKPHATVEKNDDTKKDLSRIKDGIPVGGSQKKKGEVF
jgi:diadenosine tetraphosphate (Ap4A) HIT family hydrolase